MEWLKTCYDKTVVSLFLFMVKQPAHMTVGKEKFGVVLGRAGKNKDILVHSCNYAAGVDRQVYPNMTSFSMFHEGIFTGVKYQCVELARRYWLIERGLLFENVGMAYEILELKGVRRKDTAPTSPYDVSLNRYENNGSSLPLIGSLLIWAPEGFFTRTGHVAVVVGAEQGKHVDVAEQNVEDKIWPSGQDYSRRLLLTQDGRIQCSKGGRILGWVSISDK